MASCEDPYIRDEFGNCVEIPNIARTIKPETKVCVKRQFDTDDESTVEHFTEEKKLCTDLNTTSIEKYHEIFLCHDIRKQLDRLREEVRSFITRPEYLVPFLQPGRLVKVKKGNLTFDWGVVMGFERISFKDLFYFYPVKDKTVIIIDILLHLSKDSEEGNPIPCREDEEGEMEVVPVLHNLISQISFTTLPYPKSYLKKPANRKEVLKAIKLETKTYPLNDPPLLHPIIHMRIKDQACKDIIKKIIMLEKRLCIHCRNVHFIF